MKVLQLSKFYPPIFGGIEQVALDITEGMNEKDISVDVLSVNNTNKTIVSVDNSSKIIRAAILFTLLSTPISISYILAWWRVRNDYDIIHVHLPNPLAVLALILFPPAAPIILHWHSDIVKQKMALKIFKPLQNALLKKASKIIVTSDIYGQSSSQLVKVRDKIISVPIGIEPNRLPINENLLAHLKKKYKDKKVVFSLGRLVYYKGFNNLVKAMNFLGDDVILLIGGQGELFDELSRCIIENGLKERVVLLGAIKYEELSAYYMLCDVFCLPSVHKSEAFGVVQLEAMSYGKPVVSTNIKNSGVPWVNKNEESGLVVEPNDPRALAYAIGSVLTRSEYFAQGALERYHNMFTRDKMISNLVDVYSNIHKGN